MSILPHAAKALLKLLIEVVIWQDQNTWLV